MCLTENVKAKQATNVDALAVVKQRRKAEVVLVRIVQDFGENNERDISIIHTCSRLSLSLLSAGNEKGKSRQPLHFGCIFSYVELR